MTDRQMRYFLAVAETLHFRRAAERLHMTQPPLSQQIASFEEELGVPLFTRDRRSVALTEAGESLLSDVRRILADMEAAERRAVDTGLGRVGRLRVGFIGPAIDGPLGPDLKAFCENHPGITLELMEKSTPELVERVRGKGLDAAVVRVSEPGPDGLERHVYHRESYVLAVPVGHRLAKEQAVETEMLDDEPLIMFPRKLNPVLYDQWTAMLSGAGARLRVAQEVLTKHATVALVAAGLGVSPVPRSTADSGRRDVTFIPFAVPTPELTFHLIARPEPHGPALATFLAQLLKKPGAEGALPGCRERAPGRDESRRCHPGTP
ncbi:Hca operon transcriptional activator [Pseudodesulfovibrio hydrargyri]|uniref:Hca operon transcriptional activator n=1 Tax=Pseudodesulfovibrio hydrargyri TaxID=2125990 RepID=A0A1J5NBI1_9BACT|nr:LysR substrate-binding domain-containing protein [Pseudodesulfovibrio hydrargyri]OIQ49089.1 Hca operon transcriptional activator [Pseudodesulfovibrio hydrargyri]